MDLLPLEIESSGRDEREVQAALTFLWLFQENRIDGSLSEWELISLITWLFRGNNRLIATRDAIPLLVGIRELGIQKTWEAAAWLGCFRHIDMPMLPNERLDLNSMSATDCDKKFRFDRDEIRQIAVALPFPDVIKTPQRDSIYLVEALCLLFARFAYPGRLETLKDIFKRHVGLPALRTLLEYTSKLTRFCCFLF